MSVQDERWHYWREKFQEAALADPTNPRAGLPFIFAGWIERKLRREYEQSREIFWITINPKPDVEFHTFHVLMRDRLMKRVFMKGAVYVFEQRAHDAPYQGFHCHIMCDKRMSPKQMHDRIYNTVKDIVGTRKHVDLRTYPYTYREEKLDYMNGKKWDTDKEKSVIATRQWRKENDIEDFYQA